MYSFREQGSTGPRLVRKPPCELNMFYVITTTESVCRASKMHLSLLVAWASVRSKAMVLLLIHCFNP